MLTRLVSLASAIILQLSIYTIKKKTTPALSPVTCTIIVVIKINRRTGPVTAVDKPFCNYHLAKLGYL